MHTASRVGVGVEVRCVPSHVDKHEDKVVKCQAAVFGIEASTLPGHGQLPIHSHGIKTLAYGDVQCYNNCCYKT